jgi:hypothetical protein
VIRFIHLNNLTKSAHRKKIQTATAQAAGQPASLLDQMDEDAVPLLQADGGTIQLGKVELDVAIGGEAVHHELAAL